MSAKPWEDYSADEDDSDKPWNDSGLTVGSVLTGAADIAGAGVYGTGEAAVEGLVGLGALPFKGSDAADVMDVVPDYQIGEDAKGIINFIAEKYKDSPQVLQDIITYVGNIPQAAGDATLEATGSPAAATLIHKGPEMLATALGGGVAVKQGQNVVDAAVDAARATPAAAMTAVNKGTELAKQIFDYQSPVKTQIAELLTNQTVDKRTAGWALPLLERFDESGNRIAGPTEPYRANFAAVVDDLSGEPVSGARRGGRVAGMPKIIKDKLESNVLKQGFDKGIVAMLKGVSSEDRVAMRRMLERMRAGKNETTKGILSPPRAVIGQSLMDRVNFVWDKNKEAASKLDDVSLALKGKSVDYSDALNTFQSRLDQMGITLDENNVPNFYGSDIEGLDAPIRIIKRAMERMTNTQPPDAHDVHRLKSYIDNQVVYGSGGIGLKGKTERILKELRHNLDAALDSKFDEYNKVNTTYSDTRNALDDIRSLAGKNNELDMPNIDARMGAELRKIMSNYGVAQGRLNSLDDIERVAAKYGGKFNSNILPQVLFNNELDRMFGTLNTTSLEGTVSKAIKKGIDSVSSKSGAASAGIDFLGRKIEESRKISEDDAFDAMRELLQQR